MDDPTCETFPKFQIRLVPEAKAVAQDHRRKVYLKMQKRLHTCLVKEDVVTKQLTQANFGGKAGSLSALHN